MNYTHETGNNGPLRLNYAHIRENNAHARENNAHLPNHHFSPLCTPYQSSGKKDTLPATFMDIYATTDVSDIYICE